MEGSKAKKIAWNLIGLLVACLFLFPLLYKRFRKFNISVLYSIVFAFPNFLGFIRQRCML